MHCLSARINCGPREFIMTWSSRLTEPCLRQSVVRWRRPISSTHRALSSFFFPSFLPSPRHNAVAPRPTAFASKLDDGAARAGPPGMRRPATGHSAAAAGRPRAGAPMGGSAIDGLIFADFRATSPLVVQISRGFSVATSRRPRRRWRNQYSRPADWACIGRLDVAPARPSASLKTNQ